MNLSRWAKATRALGRGKLRWDAVERAVLQGLFLSFSLVGCACRANGASNPVILISVDTLRADHLSCYGYNRLTTEHIDSLAHGGTIFEQVNAQVPLTLPSHISLLTSTYPFANGIEDNGEPLSAKTVTLAGVLQSHGYRTAAFVGGFVLDRRFGLAQGFEYYDSPFDLTHKEGVDPSEIKRSGQQVTAAAKRWLEANPHGPFFLFLHFYDLHTPYDASPDFRRHFGQGYDPELAYVDSVVGDFLECLSRAGLLDRSLIVFIGDHGESLGEHGEGTHGYFVYQSTLRVPLIIHWPKGPMPFPTSVSEPAGLIDVAPTILQFLGIGQPREFQGQSLMGLFKNPGNNDRAVFSESLYAHDHFGAGALRSLRIGGWKFIAAPKPEIYDLKRDPSETTNLFATHSSVAGAFHEKLVEFLARYKPVQPSGDRKIDPEVAARLRSLGYVSYSTSQTVPLESGPDPKDLLPDYKAFERALALSSSGSLPKAGALLRDLLDKNPGLIDVRITLGLNEQKLGDQQDAAQQFQSVLKQQPLNVLAHYNLAVSYAALRQTDNATKELEATLALDPAQTQAEDLLAGILIEQGRYDGAANHLEHVLTVFPDDYLANYNLGILAARNQHWDAALQDLKAAVRSEPGSAEGHNALGSVYLKMGQPEEARKEFDEAIRLNPRFGSAHFNLGLVLRAEGKLPEAAQEFRIALSIDPTFEPARTALLQLPHTE